MVNIDLNFFLKNKLQSLKIIININMIKNIINQKIASNIKLINIKNFYK